MGKREQEAYDDLLDELTNEYAVDDKQQAVEKKKVAGKRNNAAADPAAPNVAADA